MGKAGTKPMKDSNSPPLSCFNYISQLLVGILSWMYAALGRFVIRILAIGPIPEHIAIIMDGNRRFADRLGLERHRGHIFGYYQLIRTLEYSWELGIKYVTVYAFSIDNFARSREEVNTLMNLLTDKLNELMTKDTLLNDYGVRVQLLGDLELLPENVRAAAERVMNATRNNTAVVLNLCVAYTATAEMVHSVEQTLEDFLKVCREGVSDGNNGLNNGAYEKLCADQPGSGRPSGSEIRGKHNADMSALQVADVKSEEMGLSSGDSDSRGGSFVNGVQREKEVEEGGRSKGSFLGGEVPGVGDNSLGEHEYNLRDDDDDDDHGRRDLVSKDELAELLDSVTVKTLENRLYTAGCPNPDILLRTSGETRLSNFMLWQCCSDSRLVFCNVLWPEFQLRHFSLLILEYQRAFSAMQKQRDWQRQLVDSKDQ